MVIKIHSLIILLISFVNVCMSDPITTPQTPKKYEIKLPIKLTKHGKTAKSLADSGAEHCYKGQFKSAIKLFNAAIKKADKNGENNAEYYEGRGNCYRKMQGAHNLVKAIADFRMAVQKAPNVSNYKFFLCDSLIDNYENDEAVKETNLSGLDPETLAHLGRRLHGRLAYKQAIECYSAAIEQAPEPAVSYFEERALCHKELGSLNSAADDFREALKKAPLDGKIQWNLTSILFQLGENDQALEVAFGMDDRHLSQLADDLYYALKFDDAIRCYTKLIIGNTDNVRAFKRRGFCHWKTGNLDMAISDYEDALRLDQDCTSCRLAMIELYCGLQKYDHAKAVLGTLDVRELSDMEARIVEKATSVISKGHQENEEVNPSRLDWLYNSSVSNSANDGRIHYPVIHEYKPYRRRR